MARILFGELMGTPVVRKFGGKLSRCWLFVRRLFLAERDARAFAQWCKNVPREKGENVKLSGYAALNDAVKQTEQFVHQVQEKLENSSLGGIYVDHGLRNENKSSVLIDGADLRIVDRVVLDKHAGGSLSLKNLSAWEVTIGPLISDRALSVVFENCRIKKLRFFAGHSGAAPNQIVIRNCSIGLMAVERGAIRDLEVSGGCVLSFESPAPDAENPFTGSVSFGNDVFLPRSTKGYLLTGPQPYRNMRSHLRKLENASSANIFHAAELAVEREKDTWTNQMVSRIYEVFSDFGASIFRPLLWLLLLIVTSNWIVLNYGGVVSALPDNEMSGSWRQVLVDGGEIGKLAGSLYVCVQSIVNPFGVFGYKALVIPVEPWIAVWLLFHSFISLILVALVIVAVRRRFKLQT